MRMALFSASFVMKNLQIYLTKDKKIKHSEKINYCQNFNSRGCPFEDKNDGFSIPEIGKFLIAIFVIKLQIFT